MTNKKNVKNNKKRQINPLIYKIFNFILIILTVGLLGLVIYNDLLPLKELIPIGSILVIIVLVISFILNIEKLRGWIKNIFLIIGILLIVLEAGFLIYGSKVISFINNITDTGYRVDLYGVYVLKDEKYSRLEDLNGKTITFLTDGDDELVEKVKEKINKMILYKPKDSENVEELLNKLDKRESDAVVFNTSYEDILDEELGDLFGNMKKIAEIDTMHYVKTIESNVDITKNTFAIYISGIDTSGKVGSKARSDVNIILAVNPNTKEILMVNTPRDYYITLKSKGKKDKLTHAGIYGVEESLKSLANFYDIDIDYYVRINFTSFIKIINALDGIKVNVPKSICEQDSKRNKKNKICINKGYRTLNGEQALALARHRKTLQYGDRTRGENQMLVLEAMINKALSPAIITKFDGIMNALEGKVLSNMKSSEITDFIKKQVGEDNNWSFKSISATGRDSRGICYATGSGRAYVMEPDMDSVNEVKAALNKIFNKKTKTTKAVD